MGARQSHTSGDNRSTSWGLDSFMSDTATRLGTRELYVSGLHLWRPHRYVSGDHTDTCLETTQIRVWGPDRYVSGPQTATYVSGDHTDMCLGTRQLRDWGTRQLLDWGPDRYMSVDQTDMCLGTRQLRVWRPDNYVTGDHTARAGKHL